MYARRGNKRPVETFLVASGSDQALYNTSGSGNHINNTSTGAVRLAEGQLGIFSGSDWGSVAENVATDATPTITEAPVIYIAQGTADSANPGNSDYKYPLFARPFEQSGNIDSSNRILATKQAYVAGTNSTWVVGDTGALATGGISAESNTEYGLSIAYRGRVIDEDFNPKNTNSFNVFFTTPDYTSVTNPEDHLIQNLMWNVNRNSRAIAVNKDGNEPVVGIALDLTGSVGQAVSGLSAGFLPLVTTNAGNRGITLTSEDVTDLQAALPTGSSIVTINTTTAGASAGGANAFAIRALDRRLAYEDRIPQTKVRLELGLRAGFDWQQVHHEETAVAYEGENTARQLDLWYRATHGQRKYNLDHIQDPIVEFPSPIDMSKTYVRYVIEYASSHRPDSFNTIVSPEKCVVLIETEDTTTVSQFDSAIDSWLTSAGSDLVSFG